jgi:hypothetical protein
MLGMCMTITLRERDGSHFRLYTHASGRALVAVCYGSVFEGKPALSSTNDSRLLWYTTTRIQGALFLIQVFLQNGYSQPL